MRQVRRLQPKRPAAAVGVRTSLISLISCESVRFLDREHFAALGRPLNTFRCVPARKSPLRPWSQEALLPLSRRERSDREAIRVRGYAPSIDLDPSPASHLTMRDDLSLR